MRGLGLRTRLEYQTHGIVFSSQVHLHRDKVTWPGAKIQKPGEGMPNYENNKIRGTLYITVDVKFPKKAFSEQDSEGMILFLLCGIIFGLQNWEVFWEELDTLGPSFLSPLPLPLS